MVEATVNISAITQEGRDVSFAVHGVGQSRVSIISPVIAYLCVMRML